MIAGMGSRVNAIYELLFALRDRHIPANTAEVYDYKSVDPEFPESKSISGPCRN